MEFEIEPRLDHARRYVHVGLVGLFQNFVRQHSKDQQSPSEKRGLVHVGLQLVLFLLEHNLQAREDAHKPRGFGST